MHCHYCGKRLSISKVLRGHNFCSPEHQELYLSSGTIEAFDRLRDSLDPSPPKKPKAERARAGTPAALVQRDQPQPEPVETPQPLSGETVREDELASLMDAIAETPAADSQPIESEQQSSRHELAALMEGLGNSIEPRPVEAQQEDPSASPELVVASPIESAQTKAANNLPEAWSLFGLSSGPDQPAISLKGPGAEPASGGIQPPITTGRDLPLQNPSPLVVDISATRTQRPRDAGPMPSHPTWRNVAPGYPPVIVSDSTTLVVDPKAADFLPLAMEKPYLGAGPPPLAANEAIDPPLRKPRLPSAQPERQPAFHLSELWESLEPAGLSGIRWQPRQWLAAVSLAPMDALAPQCDIALQLAASRSDNGTAVAAAGFIALEFAAPAGSPMVTATAAAPLSATSMPSLPQSHPETLARRGSLAPAPVFGRQPAAMITAPREEPIARVQAFSSVPVDVDLSISRRDRAVLTAAGLPPDPRAHAVESPIATVPLPSVELGSAEISIPAALQHSAPVSIAAPSLPASGTIRPLQQEAHWLPAGWNEQQYSAAIAHLQPSLPSPWSLVTWAPSLATSGAAPKPSNLYNPTPLEVTAEQGRVEGIPPWSPGQRGYRLLPSLPGPGGIAAIPEGPQQARARVIALRALRPGSEGTAPPDLIRIRVHAAPMSVLGLNSQPPEIEEDIGLRLAGPFLESSLTLDCLDSAHEAVRISGDVSAAASTVLPAVASARYSPVLGLASSNDRVWGHAIPPNQALKPIAPFPALKRVAGSVAAS